MIDYPFLDYINEDKSKYKTATEAGYKDPDNLFLIGDSGGFLLNINPNHKFINTELFSETSKYYLDNNLQYITAKKDSVLERQFRKREEHRRKVGYIAPCLWTPEGIKNVRITGAHYNFLNYNKIVQLDTKTIVSGKTNTARKINSFPKFIDSQFWFWHILEFSENNGFHLLIDKTRRGGFSYMMASDSSNTINLNPNTTVIHVAADKSYLTKTGGLSDFSMNNLNFYEDESPFTRGRISINKEDFRLGFKDKTGVESNKSWKSALLSVSAKNNPNCAIGKDARKVKVEEVSEMDNFDEFMKVTEPAMRTGAYMTGQLCAWGTNTAGDMQTFERNFYNPKANNFMPFENVWDKDSRSEVCGFFKPYCWGLQGEINGEYAMDKDGNSNVEVALKIVEKERSHQKSVSVRYKDYSSYLGQYAIYPSESFSNSSDNIFNSEELTNYIDRLKTDRSLHFYEDGMLFEDKYGNVSFKSNKALQNEGFKTYDYIINVPKKDHEDPDGCIRIYYQPKYIIKTTYEGKSYKYIPDKLYSISYDPVGIDKDKDEITNRHSFNSISVWENPHEVNGFKGKQVACYFGRKDSLKEVDDICRLLAIYYNCVGTTNVEVNRGETVSNFRSKGALKYLGSEPLYVFDSNYEENLNKSYGYVIDGVKKLEALRLLKDMLYSVIGYDEYGNQIKYYQTILDLQSLLELQKWNNKGNFDRVSQMLIRAIEYKAFEIKAEMLLNKGKLSDDEISDSSNYEEEEDFFERSIY